MSRARRHVPALIAVGAVAALSGCGGSSDADQIKTIVSTEASNPASLCDHLTNALLSRVGGKAGCERAAASEPKDPTTHATNVTVNGNRASAVIVDRTGTHTITLVKEGGTWKASGGR